MDQRNPELHSPGADQRPVQGHAAAQRELLLPVRVGTPSSAGPANRLFRLPAPLDERQDQMVVLHHFGVALLVLHGIAHPDQHL